MEYNRNIKGNELRKIDGKYQSRYLLDAEYVHQELNKISNSFCLAKWFNVSIHIPTGRTHSCYHPRSHAIPLEEIKIDVSALHNTKYKKGQRQLMLSGTRPKECEFCWQIEDSGSQLSDRAYRSKDVWEPGLVDEALIVGTEGNANPRYVEVNFNQACNFKCSYCSAHLSTAWFDEVKKHGPYKLSEFDYVKNNPKKDLHLSITSNCCPPGNQWSKFMSSLKEITDADAIDHFMLFCSLDSWGKQAEYIRNGMNFDLLYKNVCDYLQNADKHSLTFIITFNALSYTGFYNYIENILSLRKQYNTNRQLVWFDVPQLIDPDFLNPKLIPELVTELERTIEFMKNNPETRWNEFKGFSDFEISKVQRLIDWIKSDTGFNKNLAMENFYMFFSQHDERRNTDFLETFPELEKFYNECKGINSV